MRRRGRSVASAYEAEVEGFKLAVSWVRDAGLNCQGPVLFCSDCGAMTVGLSSPSTNDDVKIRELRGMLDGIQVGALVQWVPGHAGLPGNEWADAEAWAATTGARLMERRRRVCPSL